MEVREQERHIIGAEIPVFDAQSGQLVGHLADLSGKGLMLIGDACPTKDIEYDLKLVLPRPEGEEKLFLMTQCRWVRMGEVDDTFESGFLVRDTSPELQTQLQNIAHEFDFFGSGVTFGEWK